MGKMETAVQAMIEYSASIVGQKITDNEAEIARNIALSVVQGKMHKVYVQNATRGQRKRLVGIAFNMIAGRRNIFCKKRSCKTCMKTCCFNERLQKRFAEEMFNGMKVY